MDVRQCKRCVFRDDDNVCEIKDIDIYEVDYEDCWFFRYRDIDFDEESEDEIDGVGAF